MLSRTARPSPSFPVYPAQYSTTTTPSVYLAMSSMLLRRSLVRALPRTRGFASEVAPNDYMAKQAALREHAAGTFLPRVLLSAS